MQNHKLEPELDGQEQVEELDEQAEYGTAEETAPESGEAGNAEETQGSGELEALTEKNKELNDKYLRLVAEYDNFRKRSQKERDEIFPSATVSAIAKFLPVLDNFERAAAYPHEDDDFGKGFDMIFSSFKEVLASMGVEEIGEVGESFDPALHHAVMHVEDESFGENVVSQVLQKGYKLGDRIIRYAMVQTAN